MATEGVKQIPESDALFTQLAESFDPSEIKWRVTLKPGWQPRSGHRIC